MSSQNAIKQRFAPSLFYQDKFYRLSKRLSSRLEILESHAKAANTVPLDIYILRKLVGKYRYLTQNYGRLDVVSLMDRADSWFKEASQFIRLYASSADHCQAIFDFYAPRSSVQSGADRVFWHCVKAKARKQANSQFMFRLVQEAYLRKSQGWYPIFNTLTVDSRYMDIVFEKGSRIWRNHIRKIERAVRSEAFGSSRANPEEQVISYFAVVERGSATQRLHIHYLLWVKTLPLSWSDPNQRHSVSASGGEGTPILREIQQVKQFWSYGFSSPIAVRSGADDPYARIGWKWPVARDPQGNYSALKTSDIQAICYYVVKYITKDFNPDTNSGGKLWRVRQNRTHGLIQIRAILKVIKSKHLFQFLQRVRIPIQFLGRWIPSKLIKWQSMKILLSRMRRFHRLIYPMMLKSTPPLCAPSQITRKPRPIPKRANFMIAPRVMTSLEMDGFRILGVLVSKAELLFGWTTKKQLRVAGISRLYNVGKPLSPGR